MTSSLSDSEAKHHMVFSRDYVFPMMWGKEDAIRIQVMEYSLQDKPFFQHVVSLKKGGRNLPVAFDHIMTFLALQHTPMTTVLP